MQDTPNYWLGRLSATVGIAAQTVRVNPKGAEKDLQDALSAFLRSPVPSEELKGMLKQYERGAK